MLGGSLFMDDVKIELIIRATLMDVHPNISRGKAILVSEILDLFPLFVDQLCEYLKFTLFFG